jgi:N-ethylmaleimide reductase
MTRHVAPALFSPIKLGDLSLGHRVAMAPLTRLRATVPGDIPNELMAEYYAQRASAGGLIVSEATTVSSRGRGYLGAPGLYDDAQIDGWRKVTDAVHRKGGIMLAQLWHVGRVGHVDLTGGELPVAPSVVPFNGVAFTADGWVPVSPHRALATDEIPALIDDCRKAAERAKAAGFDGIELHAGNGYLLDQFLQDRTNRRTDAYGGSPENRARLLLEILDEIIPIWGAARIGVRISPDSQFHEMFDSDPAATFGHLARRLADYRIAYIHVVEPRIKGSEEIVEGAPPVASAEIKRIFRGNVIAAGGFDGEGAEAIIAVGDADVVAFGRHFIANPDLPRRLEKGLPLNPYDRATFYGGDRRGYVDYPFFEQTTA